MSIIKRISLSLTNRLTIFALVVFLIGIWSITLYATQRLQKEMVALLGKQQFSSVSTVAAQLDGELHFRLNVLDGLADKVALALISTPEHVETMLKQESALQALFSGGLRVHHHDGSIVAQLMPIPVAIDDDFMALDYLAIALREGRRSVGRAITPVTEKAPILAMSAPIRSESGQVLGAVVGIVDLQFDSFFDTVMRSNLGEAGSFLLISPQQSMTISVSENNRQISPLPRPGVDTMLDRFIAGFEGYGITHNAQGLEQLSASKQVRYAGWFLIGSVPLAETFAPILNLQQQVHVSAGLVSILFGVFIALFARHVLKREFAPMLLATQKLSGIKQLTNAHLAPLPVIKQDEVGQLIQAFNQLLQRLDMVRLELTEQELHFRTLANGGSALIWTTGTLGLCNYVNQPWLAFTGRMPQEVLNRSLDQFIHRDDLDACRRVYRHAFETRSHFSMECRLCHVEGNYRWIRTDASPRFDTKGVFLGFIGFCYDIDQEKHYQQQLEQVAHFDILTGLPNRTLLLERLTQAMHDRVLPQPLLALVYMDLDDFKAINEIHGHELGDRVLSEQAQHLLEVLPPSATLGRLGGDEFAVLFVDLPSREACFPLIQRLLEVISMPIRLDDAVLQLTASIGVVFYPQADVTNADQLLRQADQAMYQAKQTGKNQYRVFDDEHERRLRDRHEFLEEIRLALSHQEFVLHYQPKVNMRTGEVLGAEALIRWHHPQRGLLSPAAFLPDFAESQLVIDLGEWVLETALAQLETWKLHGLHTSVSVNIDALHLQHPEFLSRLQCLLEKYPRVTSGDLELEVLETGALEDVAGVSQMIHACKKMGVSFALDDFGTGYSSLLYLKQLPANCLKVDQSFVRDMLEDPDDLAILEGVLGLAAAFRRETIAEGVETLQHGEMLLRLGCEWGQGYAIARPMPAIDFQAWVAHWKIPFSWQGIQRMPSERMPILYAAIDHQAWVCATVGFLKGTKAILPEQNEQACRFGRWLTDTQEQGFFHPSVLQQMHDLHHQIHHLAETLVTLKHAGRLNEVSAKLPCLFQLRDQLLDLLRQHY